MEEEFAQGGFLSPEEHMQEYLELFLLLQQGEEAFAAFARRCGRLEEREQKFRSGKLGRITLEFPDTATQGI